MILSHCRNESVNNFGSGYMLNPNAINESLQLLCVGAMILSSCVLNET